MQSRAFRSENRALFAVFVLVAACGDDEGGNAGAGGAGTGGDLATTSSGSSNGGGPGGTGAGGPGSGGGSASNSAGSASGDPSASASSGDGSTATSSGSGGGNTGQPCDPACTGTRMCDASSACVCAPGWTFDGADCIAVPVSDPTTRTKDEVCQALAAASVAPAQPWIPGSGGECDPGTVPYDAQLAVLRYLNFYRWMVGVGPVQVVPEVAQAEQECALILNYEFSHSPMPTTTCYTEAGAAACGSSLIAGGYGLVGQVDGYALETGQNFIHHRNVLAVGRAGVWFGASGGSSDMHYGGAYPALPTDPAFVAHPGPGLQVRSKVPTNWWFVESGTAVSPAVDARVHVVSSGEEKPMIRQHHFEGFSSFQTDGWTPEVDVAYRVELVADDQSVFGEFETTFIDCP